MNDAVWFGILAGFAWKSTVVLAVAWLLSLVLRSRSAAVRHLVWTAASAAVLALPLLSVSLPALRVPTFSRLAPGVAALFQTNATVQPEALSDATAGTRVAPHEQGRSLQLDWRGALLLLWAIGVAACIAQMLIAFSGVWRIRHAAQPWSIAEDLLVAHGVPVLKTKAGTMPMTCGFLKPAILMPEDAETWTEDRRRMVLLHEIAHVKRGDVVAHLLGRLALVLNWWNPLAWLAWREFLKERERATDDLVLSTGTRASVYASHLLEIARSMRSKPALACAAVAMARRSELEGRLVAILDGRVNRNATKRASMLVAVAAAVTLIAPFAAVRAQDQQSAQAIPSDIDATIRAAIAQSNYDMLDKPAEALEAARQIDSAKKLLDTALTIREKVSGGQSVAYGVGLINLGDLEKKRRRNKEAVTLYSQATQVLGGRPEAAPAWMYLGENELAGKNYQQAFDDFQKAETLDAAQSGPAQMWMAVVREREQNATAAETLYRSALAVEEPNSTEAATTLELYARFLKGQGNEQEAKSLSARAADIRKVPVPVSTALRIGNGVLPPKLLSKVEPDYTEEARAAQYQGTVVLSVEIGPDGIARNIRVVRGLGLGLDENAASAVQLWHFTPATKDGVPVTVLATIEVNFRLK